MSVSPNNLIVTFKQLDQAIDASMPQIYQKFYQLTPIKTGNARSNTSLNGRTIRGTYPYAGVLDAGRGFRDGQMRGSTQAPNGMSQPTIDYAKQIILQKLKSVGI